MIQKIHASSALVNVQNEMVSQAFREGFIEGDVVAKN
jgi:transposase